MPKNPKPLTPKQTARLLRLAAAHLRKVKPEQFNMEKWKCGLARCALSHSCDVPALKKRGLRMKKWGLGSDDSQPYCGGENYEHAGVRAFGVTIEEALYLFVPASAEPWVSQGIIPDISRSAVLRRFEIVAKRYEKKKSKFHRIRNRNDL